MQPSGISFLAQIHSADGEAHSPIYTSTQRNEAHGTASDLISLGTNLRVSGYTADTAHANWGEPDISAGCAQPTFSSASLRQALATPGITAKAKDYEVARYYKSHEKVSHCQGGASKFLAFIHNQDATLNQATVQHLDAWALTPTTAANAQGNLPNAQAFNGAKRLCALATEVGYLPEAQAALLTAHPQPRLAIESLRQALATPGITASDKDAELVRYYQSNTKSPHHLSGAKNFLAYLHLQRTTLNQANVEHLNAWARTRLPTGKARGTLPSEKAYAGAKELCALAVQMGHGPAEPLALPAEPPALHAASTQPKFSVLSLWDDLQKPGLSAKEKDEAIALNYENSETVHEHRRGAKSFLAALHLQGTTLDQATDEHLQAWALTPINARRTESNLPSAKAFAGAKKLCARAAQVGHLPAESTALLATCLPPRTKRGRTQNHTGAVTNKRPTANQSDDIDSIFEDFEIPEELFGEWPWVD